jgi:hypothetical protein
MFAITWIASLALAGAPQQPAPQQLARPAASHAATDPKQRLAILYAGCPGTEREKDFVAFLNEHFVKVETTSLGSLSPKTAAPYDVVIADWKERYKYVDGRATEYTSGTSAFGITEEFTKPIVMIGAVGGEIALWSKIGWL